MLAERMLPRARERLVTISGSAPVKDAAALMAKPHTDLVVVCGQDGEMVGVLTKTDIVGQITQCFGSGCTARVDTIMTRDVASCQIGEPLQDIWSMMKARGCSVSRSSIRPGGRSGSSMRGMPCKPCWARSRVMRLSYGTT